MKWMFASDIHGSAKHCGNMLHTYEKEGAERLFLLGDLLYHGPRNDLPEEYSPKRVIGMLNEYKSSILAVRGNCDAEVDQMVLEFPIMADYAFLCTGVHTIYLTHGHVYHEKHLPPLKSGDVLMHGHTHVLGVEKAGTITILNPGSVALPKEGHPRTYAILEDGEFQIKDFEGRIIKNLII